MSNDTNDKNYCLTAVYVEIRMGNKESIKRPTVTIDGGKYFILSSDEYGMAVTPVEARLMIDRMVLTAQGWKHDPSWRPLGPYMSCSIDPYIKFTFNREKDRSILMRLDLNYILSAYGIYPHVRTICDNEDFWREKIQRDFGNFLSRKPPDHTYYQQYHYLSFCTTRSACLESRIDALDYLESVGMLPDKEDCFLAAVRGQIPALDWLAARGMVPEARWIHTIAWSGSNSLATLRWLAQGGNGKFSPLVNNEKVLYCATVTGKLDVLAYLASKGMLPSAEMVAEAVANNHPEVEAWVRRLVI